MTLDIFKLIRNIIGITIICVLCCIPFTCKAQSYTKVGNIFTTTKTLKLKTEPIRTKFNYMDSDSIVYPIYITENGSCFINKISKRTGNNYRKYLGPDISQSVCKELNITYKGKIKTVKNS